MSLCVFPSKEKIINFFVKIKELESKLEKKTISGISVAYEDHPLSMGLLMTALKNAGLSNYSEFISSVSDDNKGKVAQSVLDFFAVLNNTKDENFEILTKNFEIYGIELDEITDVEIKEYTLIQMKKLIDSLHRENNFNEKSIKMKIKDFVELLNEKLERKYLPLLAHPDWERDGEQLKKYLKDLEEKTFEKINHEEEIKVDDRLISINSKKFIDEDSIQESGYTPWNLDSFMENNEEFFKVICASYGMGKTTNSS